MRLRKIRVRANICVWGFASVLLFLCLLSGCGEKAPRMNIDYGTRADGSTYLVYNGEAQEFFEVVEGKKNTVDVSVEKVSGTLNITIHEENDINSVIYDGHEFPEGHFTVTAAKAGRYRILIHAEDFVGSYKFRYDMGQ